MLYGAGKGCSRRAALAGYMSCSLELAVLGDVLAGGMVREHCPAIAEVLFPPILSGGA